MKFTPVASIFTRAWPGPGSGSGTSSSCITSGPPYWCTRIAFIARLLRRHALCESTRSAGSAAGRRRGVQPRQRAHGHQLGENAHRAARIEERRRGPTAEIDLLQAALAQDARVVRYVVHRVAEMVQTGAALMQKLRYAAGRVLRNQDLDLRFAFADRDEEIERALRREVGAVQPARSLLVERQAQLVHQHVAGLVQRMRDNAHMIQPDDHDALPPRAV